MSDLDGLQTRSLTIRATQSEDERAVTALGVPYNDETQIWEGLYEQFAPGSVNAEGAILRYAHSEPIGRITATRETENGVEFDGIISQTSRGNEVYQLLKDGVLTSCSIGFDGIEYDQEDREDGAHITWKKVRAREFSIVEFPAYEAAKIEKVREKQTKPQKEEDMENETTTETAETLERMEALERSLAALKDKPAPTTPGIKYRSYGEFVAGYKKGEDDAKALSRAAATGTSADFVNLPVWLGDIEKRMEAKQPIKNLFTTIALPSTGMTMEYAQKAEPSTIKTAKQAKEGAKLVTGLPATWSVQSATVSTYGGAVENITRQAIERTTSPVILDEIFKDLAYQYAATIEADVREKFQAIVTANTPVLTLTKGTTATVADLEDLLLDLTDVYEDIPYSMDGLLVSPTVFKWVKNLPRDPRALQLQGAPLEHQGTVTFNLPSAQIGQITITRVPKWEGDHMVAYSKDALTTAELPGAPLRLEDENITTLTKEFAVYGYAAIFSQHPDLIKPVKIGA
ncbi:MAG: HK97 family phage prohead protease [Varibaculum cambriense]|uniref:HK97 family phage prohead protease n=1 Tax=Varibaculum cambriense TaxID=184870 RepID=UPI00241C56C1|nr:HK97 family phage prohead protease [Varibaculum cambriense]MBS5972934.1 HK97 family phage prohead protease [Varibaculum cambriense]